jgi:nucleoside-diphosphate-sugar epimerase
MTDLRTFYKGTPVLVTGGAGAIGGRLIEALKLLGAKIIVVDDLSSGINIPKGKNVTFYKGTILNERLLKRVFKHDIDVVFHLAANFANQNSVDHPLKDLMVNGWGTYDLFDRSVKSGVQKFVFASSSCVYAAGGTRAGFAETRPSPILDTPYATHKMLGELYANYFHHSFGLPTLTVRIFNTFGPGEQPGKYRNVIPNFIKIALGKKPLPITGTGDEVREFNYVDDTVAKLLYLATRKTTPNTVYNLCGGRSKRIIDLAKAINRLTKNPAGVLFFPPRSWDHVRVRVGNATKLRRTGYFENPSVRWLLHTLDSPHTFDAQLKATIAFVKKHS